MCNIQPIIDRVAQNLEIISTTFSTNQNSAHGIYVEYQVINDKSQENPGTPGTKLNFLEIISRFCATLSAIGCSAFSNGCNIVHLVTNAPCDMPRELTLLRISTHRVSLILLCVVCNRVHLVTDVT